MSGFPIRPCLIILNGEIRDQKAVLDAARLCRSGKTPGAVLCSDGGLRHAASLKIVPDFVIGDMDSLPKPIPRFKKKRPLFWCDFDENRSDFEKTMDWAIERGFKTAYIAGALGGGLDHTLVNLAMIERFASKIALIVLDTGRGFLLRPGKYRIGLKQGQRFSLLAAPEVVASLLGARYALRKERLRSPSHGLGNSAKGEILLQVHRGQAWFLTGSKMGLDS